jgi:hypothetical protein
MLYDGVNLWTSCGLVGLSIHYKVEAVSDDGWALKTEKEFQMPKIWLI